MAGADANNVGVRYAAALGQGSAVAEAMDGPISRDVDRWQHFLKSQVAAMAVAPASPPDAEKPRAGLARNGGNMEGEHGAPPSTPPA